jgi:hypothetical protein
MSRYERKLFFERLVAMRQAYRTESHEALDLTMADAMALAQRTLAQLAFVQAVVSDGAAPATTTPDAEHEA